MQPESKFLDADYLDQGTTIRRHVQMIATRHIGKESNDWERQAVLGLNADAQPDYGISESDRSRLLEKLGAFITGLGKTKAARALGTTPMRLNQLLAGAPDRAMIRLAQSIAERLPTQFSFTPSWTMNDKWNSAAFAPKSRPMAFALPQGGSVWTRPICAVSFGRRRDSGHGLHFDGDGDGIGCE